jgi:poly [ADP-ribose] polymerase
MLYFAGVLEFQYTGRNISHQVFKVTRSGEEKTYKPFKKLHNRKLLWHGSRLTNFAGILSQV